MAIDTAKGTSQAFVEGSVRQKYKSLPKMVFKKRAKGYFSDLFIFELPKKKLIKVFNENSLLTMDYTHYYFLNDSLICVKLERDSSTHNEKYVLQKGIYYFENGTLIYQTGQPDK